MPVSAKAAELPGGTSVMAPTDGSASVTRPSIRQRAAWASLRLRTRLTASEASTRMQSSPWRTRRIRRDGPPRTSASVLPTASTTPLTAHPLGGVEGTG